MILLLFWVGLFVYLFGLCLCLVGWFGHCCCLWVYCVHFFALVVLCFTCLCGFGIVLFLLVLLVCFVFVGYLLCVCVDDCICLGFNFVSGLFACRYCGLLGLDFVFTCFCFLFYACYLFGLWFKLFTGGLQLVFGLGLSPYLFVGLYIALSL